MGFFFTNQTLQNKRSQGKGARKAAPNRQNVSTLNRLGCAACTLNKAAVHTPKMQPDLAKQTLVYCLAEAPGKHEDQTSGRPLTGPSGKLLRGCIPEGMGAYTSFDNVVRDRPPNNREPTWHELECCRNKVTTSIEQAKPKLILGLGKIPLNWMLGSTDQQGMRGRLFAVKVGQHTCWFLPTYHPSYVLRQATERTLSDPLKSMAGHCFKMDVANAFAMLDDLPNAVVDSEAEARASVQCFTPSSDFDRLSKLLTKAVKAPVKAIDVETSVLRPYSTNAKLLTCAVSYDDTNFAFVVDHPKAAWSSAKRNWLLTTLRILLTDSTIKIAHNATFELEWFISLLGKDAVRHGVWHCTQMQSHFLDERRGKQYGEAEDRSRAAYQSLGFLCKQYFGLDYKRLFNLNKRDMVASDLNEMLLYNAVDTKYTLRLYHHQKRLLKEQGLWAAYCEALPRETTVALMQHIGVDVSQSELKTAQTKLDAEITQLTTKINAVKEVVQYRREHGGFNPASGDDLLAVFKDYIKAPQVVRQGNSKKTFDFNVPSKLKKKQSMGESSSGYSLDKNVLKEIDHPLAPLILSYRTRTKLKSTYINPFELGKGAVLYPDGKLHTNFNLTFAETGRLSSDEPNMQNFPKRNDSWVRRIIVPPKGHVLLAFDYGQLEGCTAAMCSKDNVLVNAMWEDYDIHQEWAMRLADEYPRAMGNLDKKQFRSLVKNKLVFPAIFGAANDSIAGYLDVPVNHIDNLMEDFWQTFTGLKDWQNRLMRSYYENGYVESPTGRRHRYPLRRNQAINFPVQSVACDIVCQAMCTLSQIAMAEDKWYLHPVLNIHDDLSMCVPDNDRMIDEAIETILKVMLKPTYDFINVPIAVEASIGANWFEMQTVGKFWSHKDL